MQTQHEKSIRKQALVKVGVGSALMLAIYLLGWIPAVISYFERRNDVFPLSLVFEVAHYAVAFLLLLPWLCFSIGLLELIMGLPFRAISWDWDHSRRVRLATAVSLAGLVTVGLLLLVLQHVFHLDIL